MKFLNKKFLIILVAILVLISLGFLLKQLGLLDINKIENLVNSAGIFGPIVFGLIYILVTLTGISAVVFTVLAGTLFGTVNGLIIVILSATISAIISFYIARFFKDKISNNKEEKKNNTLNNLISKIEKNAKEKGFLTMVILRLSFLPYIPLSYAAGLVKNLRASDFILATLITNVFGSFVFIFLGDRLKGILEGNFDMQTISTLIIAIILLVAFIIFVPRFMKRFQK